MRTIISGPVTAQDIEDADLLAGISPTSFIYDETDPPPHMPTGVECEPYKLSNMMDYSLARAQLDAVLITWGDALIIRDGNPVLLEQAKRRRMPVYEA